MARRKRSMAHDALGLTATGMTLGIGGSMIGSLPNAPAGAGQSLTAFGSMMPAMGTAMGGGYAIGAMQGMIPKTRRRKHRR